MRVREVDRPVAALIGDLKQRGLLDDTLVVWTSEMGRTPFAQGKGDRKRLGRNHNQYAMVSWLAGGGIRGGACAGETDEFGMKGVGDSLLVRDFHATVLHALGLNDAALTYLHQGRFKRLTDTGGRVIKDVLA
jgi:arylsulfatase A-like enzyme